MAKFKESSAGEVEEKFDLYMREQVISGLREFEVARLTGRDWTLVRVNDMLRPGTGSPRVPRLGLVWEEKRR